MSPATTWPVDGSSGIWPDRNRNGPAAMAWLYGPIAAGASDVETGVFTGLGRLGDLAGPDATGADADATHAAVNHCPNALEVHVEPARADVVGMAQDPAERRCLATNFTLLGHSRCLGCGPRTALEHPSMPHQLGQNQMGALSRLTGTVSGDTGTV